MKIIAMQGVPGSGKSSTVARLAAEHNAVVICLDDIRAELTGDASDQSRNAEVMPLATARASAALAAGRSIIVDSTMIKREWLGSWEAMASKHGADLVLVSVRVTLATAQARNASRSRVVPAHVIERMYNDLQAFDYRGLRVQVVDNN